MPAEQFKNAAQTTLAAAVDGVATTLTVNASPSRPFPSLPQFRVRIDDELLLVTAVAGTTWTVTRAVEGPGGAAAHPAGALVTQVLTAAVVAAFVPAGTISPFAGVRTPTGWLRCDGTAVSRTTYSDLFSAICPTYTGNTTNGSANITSVSDTFSTELSEMTGRVVEGPGIPSGATIVSLSSVGGGVINVTLSANCTATATGITFRVCPFGRGDGSTTFNVPDLRRRTLVGIGGSGTATLANTLAATGGSETHTLSTSEIPSHNHAPGGSAPNFWNRAWPGGSFAINYTAGTGDSTSSTTANTGGGGAHNNLQPSLVVNYIIKT